MDLLFVILNLCFYKKICCIPLRHYEFEWNPVIKTV